MLVFESFTFLIKFFPTEAIDQQFCYYDYSKIVLPQLYTKCIFHDFFGVQYFLQTYWLILINRVFQKSQFFISYKLPSLSVVQKISMSTTYVNKFSFGFPCPFQDPWIIKSYAILGGVECTVHPNSSAVQIHVTSPEMF